MYQLRVSEKRETLWHYGPWKIFRLAETRFECVRVFPTRWFKSTSLDSALRRIDREECPLWIYSRAECSMMINLKAETHDLR